METHGVGQLGGIPLQPVGQSLSHQLPEEGGGPIHRGKAGGLQLPQLLHGQADTAIHVPVALLHGATEHGGREGGDGGGGCALQSPLVPEIVLHLVVGEDGGGAGAEAQGRSRLGHGALAQGMGDATAVLERDGLARQSHAGKGKEGEIVGEGHAGALTCAFAHGAAETAVYRAVVFLLPHLQLGHVDAQITVHGKLLLIRDLFLLYRIFRGGSTP